MPAHKREHTAILTSEGQAVTKVQMTIDGATIPVVPASIAAARTGYSETYIRMMCDGGQLIAIKVHGRWWIHERAAFLLA